MRSVLVLIASVAVLAACGGKSDDIAAKKKALEALRAEKRALSAELAEGVTERQAVKDAVIPAKKALEAARGTDEEGSMQAAFEAAQEASREVLDYEKAKRAKIQEVDDRIRALEREIQAMGGKI